MARRLSSRFTTHLPGTPGLQLICLLALLQIALGLAGLVAAAAGVQWTPPTMVRNWQRAVEIVLLGALALYLLQGAGRDVRLANLGALFLLIAVFFAHPPSRALALALPEGPAYAVRLARAITVDAFTPALAWLFARDFPRALESRASARVVDVAIRVSVVAALFLIAANLVIEIRGNTGALARFDRNDAFGHYWTVCFGLLVPIAPFILWRMRHAPIDERRRVRLFGVGIALVGVFPVLLAVVPPWFPSLAEKVHGELGAKVLVPMNLALILAMAATTAYSVAVRQVLDVRTVLRQAAQYGLARLAVGALVVLPLVFISIEIYRVRGEPIASLFETRRLLWLAGAVVAFLVVVRIRQRLIVAIDRLFFREPYDARSVLGALMKSAGGDVPIDAWAKQLIDEIDRALHVESGGLLVATFDGEEYQPVVGALRRLPRDSVLARQLEGQRAPVRIALERPSDFFNSLPHDAQVWLADGNIDLLVPLPGSGGSLSGILTLGPKRSELPFSRQDLLMLETVAASVGISLENRLLRESAGHRQHAEASEDPASECTSCSRVNRPGATACEGCGSPTQVSTLPRELFGKFRVEERIGHGGMGVVYRAADITLERSVALKTLPARSPDDAQRLRREARTMAAITHPNLALILGVETWQGTPIVVLEYLAGGTLEKRLQSGPLPLAEVLELTRLMARVLEKVHRAGILHRDVKPSNIGYTEERVPKLLDFGLARIVGEASPGVGVTLGQGTQSVTGFAGTPLYMCPEAFDMARPGAGFDLWSLSVVAFEAANGAHPFERANSTETLRAIRRGFDDGLRASIATWPETISELFARLLSGDPGRRPATAAEMAEWVADAKSGGAGWAAAR